MYKHFILPKYVSYAVYYCYYPQKEKKTEIKYNYTLYRIPSKDLEMPRPKVFRIKEASCVHHKNAIRSDHTRANQFNESRTMSLSFTCEDKVLEGMVVAQVAVTADRYYCYHIF